MNSLQRLLALFALVVAVGVAPATPAQTLLTEDFTGTTSSANGGIGNWLFFDGACLTAGTSTSLASPASSIPACTTVLNSYYVNSADHDQYLMGGQNGYLGGASPPASPASQQPDPATFGALRFTNGRPFGSQQRGAIVSSNAYPTGAGIQVTFKTVTYGGTGADGISFYLMDGCVPVTGAIMPTNAGGNPACTSPLAFYPQSPTTVPAIGATGGSLAYTCSNTNSPYDGLTGAYLGLGIDEYGNFLNQGDNTGSGYGFQPGRIGLRGAGAISWPALNRAYGVNPNNPGLPFYPSSLNASCAVGAFDPISGTCGVCPVIGPTSSTVGTATIATATSTVYTNAMCANTTTTTTTTSDTGCTTSGYALRSLNGAPICVQSATCAAYLGASDSTYPNGVCTDTPVSTTPSLTCNTGYTPDPAPGGLGVCGQQPTTNAQFTNTVGSSTATTNAAPTSSSITSLEAAVQQTCSSGHLWNYLNPAAPTDAGPATLPGDPTNPNVNNTAGVLDYAPIPNAFLILPPGNPLFNGAATKRSQGRTIFYNLKITSDGFLSLAYAYNGGTYQTVIANQNIQAANGPMPSFVRFGFAGSTGGATNVHEIMCFKSAPADQSASSAGVNEKQSAKVESGTFAYFAYYDPNNWVGRVTATALTSDPTTGVVSLATNSSGQPAPVWDASCVLTGVTAAQQCTSTQLSGPTAALAPASRVVLTYNAGGVPFEWGNLSAAQQAALGTADNNTNVAQLRLNYLRGDRSNEITSAGTCAGGLFDSTVMPAAPICFRARTSVLGDIVDSSPTWVGPPQSPYTATWQDKLYPGAAPSENAGTQSYLQYVTAEETRPNVVYVGSNDGMLHGFRSGGFDNGGTFTTATTPNDGQEVLAYVPGSLLLSATTGGACAMLAATGSVVQSINGATPAPSGALPSGAACIQPALDFTGLHYGHNFFVDATPGTGDLYYNGGWHTWLVSGLGAGGAAIFALDVSNPTAANFTEGNASNLVIGEWTAANISCQSDTAALVCKNSLGATYGTPIIRRLHDGRWAVIFGNGFGSSAGDAGIFVMTIDATGNKLFYYLSTGNTGTAANNGIAYVASADLDGDHVTDYVYAGDLMGNLWRFDLTSNVESSWAAGAAPLFSTPTGQPITTAVTVSSGPTTAGGNTVIVAFGTGNRTQFNNANPVTFAPATQGLYGVWDWNLTGWNAKSAVQYAALTPAASGLSGPLTQANLLQESFQLNPVDNVTRDIAGNAPICWAGSPACSGSPQFGWYVPLIGALEQVVYNPQLLRGVFTVNSIVPANNLPNSCTINNDTGFTYAISVMTGAAPPGFFVQFHDAQAAGMQTNAVGVSFPVTASNGSVWMVSQTVTNQPLIYQANPGANGKGRRLTWVQLR